MNSDPVTTPVGVRCVCVRPDHLPIYYAQCGLAGREGVEALPGGISVNSGGGFLIPGVKTLTEGQAPASLCEMLT